MILSEFLDGSRGSVEEFLSEGWDLVGNSLESRISVLCNSK